MHRRQTLNRDGVGEIEEDGEFGLGLAPIESKPITKIEISKEREEEIARMEQFSEYSETQDELIHEQEEAAIMQRMSRSRKQNSERRPAIDKQTAFSEFKGIESESGPALEAQILASRTSMKQSRLEIKAKTEVCNKIKAEIDLVKADLDSMSNKKKMENIAAAKDAGFGQGRGDDYLEAD